MMMIKKVYLSTKIIKYIKTFPIKNKIALIITGYYKHLKGVIVKDQRSLVGVKVLMPSVS